MFNESSLKAGVASGVISPQPLSCGISKVSVVNEDVLGGFFLFVMHLNNGREVYGFSENKVEIDLMKEYFVKYNIPIVKDEEPVEITPELKPIEFGMGDLQIYTNSETINNLDFKTGEE